MEDWNACVHAKLLQLCLAFCNPMDHSPPGSSVHGILQARILEGVPCPPPGDLPIPGIKLMSLMSPSLTGSFFTTDTICKLRRLEQVSILSYPTEGKW